MGKVGGGRRVETYDAKLGEDVARAQQGDEAAFAAAFRLVQPRLLGYLRGLVGDDAEDVASDAWLEIVRDLGRFRGDGAGFRAWTACIARNRAIDHLRRLRSRPRGTLIEQDPMELPARQNTAAEALETISTVRAVALITALPHRQAEAVLLRTVIGLDGPAAARVLGRRPGAVRAATHRGLRRLGKHLATLGRSRVTDSDSRALGEGDDRTDPEVPWTPVTSRARRGGPRCGPPSRT
ncbi:RNA polymerase sigma-70 factor (ECF subfamily) [Streptomyces sp. SLBN-118]|uniref:RNA polymerase sigma factor n=1 Tax=Streptomyces sp. SLBN-118 TaxID=2768454 RepID=UPI0011730AD3|nr:RNA polymerase sigma factor [Streptomyces sp. SLBN-118]TQK51116.1 RNA polymerase sigma-70 factor (ECF subfamily) [Streptomyces sp. SLBN-118]